MFQTLTGALRADVLTNTITSQIKRGHDVPLIRDVISLNHYIPFQPRSNEAVHHSQ